MNSDWVDFLRELNAAGVRYLLVGAHAVGVHGVPRATRDIVLMTSVSGVPDFAGAWDRRKAVTFADTAVDVIGREDLLRNKEASGREKDRLDIRELGRLG